MKRLHFDCYHHDVYDALRNEIGAIADTLPAFLWALPDKYRWIGFKEQIRRHLAEANFRAVLREHDRTVKPAKRSIRCAAAMLRKEVLNNPEVMEQTRERLAVSAILRMVYSPDRRADLWE